MITVASKQYCKIEAVVDGLEQIGVKWLVRGMSADSKVSEQPFGKEEIERGALNRLESVNTIPSVSFETGIICESDKYYDISYCLFKADKTIYESWSEKIEIKDTNKITEWLNLENRQNTTLGSLIDPQNPSDWYKIYGYNSRQFYLTECFIKAYAYREFCSG